MLIFQSLPRLYQVAKLQLIFSTALHGYSLATLYDRSKNFTSAKGMLFCLKTTLGAVFGGFSNEVFQVTEEYHIGSEDCLVFSILPERRVYKSAGINPDHLRCCSKYFSMGGRGHGEAIRINDSFESGTTYASETYANVPLTGPGTDTMFTIRDFEAYALS